MMKKTLSRMTAPAAALAPATQSRLIRVANMSPADTPVRVRYTHLRGSWRYFQSMTDSSTPPKMKANTAGRTGSIQRRQVARAMSAAVPPLSQYFMLWGLLLLMDAEGWYRHGGHGTDRLLQVGASV